MFLFVFGSLYFFLQLYLVQQEELQLPENLEKMQDFKILSDETKFFFTGEHSFLKTLCTYIIKVFP